MGVAAIYLAMAFVSSVVLAIVAHYRNNGRENAGTVSAAVVAVCCAIALIVIGCVAATTYDSSRLNKVEVAVRKQGYDVSAMSFSNGAIIASVTKRHGVPCAGSVRAIIVDDQVQITSEPKCAPSTATTPSAGK
jgi:hypothetical protein